jgi:HSP20 family molecular chaperone IbpA
MRKYQFLKSRLEVSLMENKPSKKTELTATKKKPTAISKPSRKTSSITAASPSDIWQAFDDTFERFRNDFEDVLFPTNWVEAFSFVPEVRVPVIDLKDGEKEYSLKAEMPGFKKEDIEIEVQDNGIEITGTAGWKYDEKGHLYICKERACKTFYRRIELPEEIKIDEVKADIADGVLEITLPKKAPKQKRKIALK